VSSRRLSSFIDALAAGRRPEDFRAAPEDLDVARTAIELRASRPGDAAPDPGFVSRLHQELAVQMSSDAPPAVRPGRVGRGRIALISVAAGVALVGGTVAATQAFDQPALAPAAAPAPHGGELRTGTFETADNRVMGQIVVYGGSPSWVYMNVDVPKLGGRIRCSLQVKDGSTVAAGVFEVHDGIGHWSRTIKVDIGQLRGAKLVTSDGSIVASATFV
jgi:hypothetical protein